MTILDLRRGARVRINAPGGWAHDLTGTIHEDPRAGEYIRVMTERGPYSALARELEPADEADVDVDERVRALAVDHARDNLTEGEARELVRSSARVVADAIRRHPIARDYLNQACLEAHAAGIVLALTQSGHIR